jgi:hypothetical protein
MIGITDNNKNIIKKGFMRSWLLYHGLLFSYGYPWNKLR